MKTSNLWYKTVLELAKSGMEWPACSEMADGIIESYLRRYDSPTVPRKETEESKAICPKCSSIKIVRLESMAFDYQCLDCNYLFGEPFSNKKRILKNEKESPLMKAPVCPKCKESNITGLNEPSLYKWKCDKCQTLFGYGPDASTGSK